MREVTRLSPEEVASQLVTGAVVVGYFSGAERLVPGHGAAVVSDALGLDITALLASDVTFRAETDQLARMVVVTDGEPRTTLIAVGLGPRDSVTGLVTSDVVRAATMRSVSSSGRGAVVNTLALECGESEKAVAAAARAVVEGAGLADFHYLRDGAASPTVGELHLVVSASAGSKTIVDAIHRGEVAADAANWVRQLVEMPGGLLGPAEFAAAILARVQDEAPDAIDASIWPAAELVERGFGATLAVGAGSARPPCVVELRSRATGQPIALAGKGITFDAGGINLKQDAAELAWMKSDMAGAAAVAAAVIAAVILGAKTPFHVVLPIAENVPGGNAQRPGDVVVHPSGRSTEVVDTDCEGRLVLADAIAWLAGTNPRAIIDVGTLTDSGAVGTALWGCWTNTPSLGRDLVEAGHTAGDPGWVLPLVSSYRSLFQSPVADSTNAASDTPDTGQMAATFLEPFAAGMPWLHLDNGSGAYLERDAAEWPKGATGTPTRALIDYLCGVASSPAK